METRHSRSRLRTKTDSNPRSRYTTAPLVINHVNTIDLAEKAFLQANQEHKQERNKHNLKLQITIRLMIMKKEFKSLFKRTNRHRRTRLRTRALVHSKRPWWHSCSKTMSISRGNQELNKTPNPNGGVVAIYEDSRVVQDPWTRP